MQEALEEEIGRGNWEKEKEKKSYNLPPSIAFPSPTIPTDLADCLIYNINI